MKTHQLVKTEIIHYNLGFSLKIKLNIFIYFYVYFKNIITD